MSSDRQLNLDPKALQLDATIRVLSQQRNAAYDEVVRITAAYEVYKMLSIRDKQRIDQLEKENAALTSALEEIQVGQTKKDSKPKVETSSD